MKNKLTNFNDSFHLANEISRENDSEKLISVIENWEYVNPSTKPIFSDLIESFGFYPYLKELDTLNTAASMRAEFHKSANLINSHNEKVTFHLEQKVLEEKISLKQNLLVSAPTSFGKSLLIEEFVARKEYQNILIIQPTLALIDETRKKLKKYDDHYNIVVNTRQNISDNNIFILTSERVLEIFPKISEIDLFIVDEFYKISSHKNDDRASQLNIAFYKIMLTSPQLLLLTPQIDDVSREFIAKYQLEFYKTEYSLVNQKIRKIEYTGSKEIALFNLLESLKEPTIVYVQSPNQAVNLAEKYVNYLAKIDNNRFFPLFEWIDENISKNWILKTFLKNGVGLHNGQYPRHIVNSQLDYFNDGLLDVIFATTSLIEGVNTVAKNIVVYDMKKGAKHGLQSLSHFDYNNIKGRAGRMMKYYTGNVFIFDNPPNKQKETIDIPIIEQDETLKSEVLINLNEEDIKKEKKKEYASLVENLDKDLVSIFKNNYFNIENQKKLYYYLRLNNDILDVLIWDTPTPSHKVLLKTFEVINHYLDGNKGESHKFWAQKCQQVKINNLKNAIYSETQYQKKHSNNKTKTDIEIENISIAIIFNFIKNEAKYEIPKKLGILESIVNYLSLDKKASYSSFIALLEHEGLDEKLGVLLDYGVPSSALRKIKNIPESNINEFIANNLNEFGLNQYEMEIMKNVFNNI